jgi:thiol-disulfide isomerase/thioredoxin
MKAFFQIVALSLGAVTAAHAYEVGDKVSCVNLKDRQVDSTLVEHCAHARDAGRDFAIVEFFSIQCGACLQNLPILQALAKDIGDTATTRLISIDREIVAVDAFLAQQATPLGMPMAYDYERLAKREFEVAFTPTIFVIDSHDKVLFKHIGGLNSSDVQAIKDLVGSTSRP